ncbi:hypothetical protein NQZ68_015134 [Dissostichus eleginoides]|nr:hypothetical protein NQZ68_015134 [Dissostichus eleginoides]
MEDMTLDLGDVAFLKSWLYDPKVCLVLVVQHRQISMALEEGWLSSRSSGVGRSAGGLQEVCRSNPQSTPCPSPFMESGHSKMECDSVHAAIETARKKGPVYSSEGYYSLVRMARRNRP